MIWWGNFCNTSTSCTPCAHPTHFSIPSIRSPSHTSTTLLFIFHAQYPYCFVSDRLVHVMCFGCSGLFGYVLPSRVPSRMRINWCSAVRRMAAYPLHARLSACYRPLYAQISDYYSFGWVRSNILTIPSVEHPIIWVHIFRSNFISVIYALKLSR